VDGGRLYYERDGNGPPLLLTGGALDIRMWESQIETLSSDYTIIRCDLRGYGRSSQPSEAPYRHCDDLRVLLDGLGIDRACIGGQSLGGTVTLDFALAYPDVVAGLILAPALPLLGWDWVEGFPVKPALDVGLREGVDAFKAAFLELPLNATAMAHPAAAPLLRQMIGDYSGWQLGHRDPGRFEAAHAIDRLDEVDAPTLIVVGDNEVLDGRLVAEHLAAHVVNAEHHLIEGVGHYPNMEDPARFNSITLQFLERVHRKH
jgi:pimeloyl-ACP methyl ester carboxylesterase